MSRRIRVAIGELVVRGASPLEAQRLRDALAAELERDAASLLEGVTRSGFAASVSAGRIRAPRRLELGAAALADAVGRAVRR